jgi:CDP-diacylglycerol---glycerol-3-phosphate 3-phosphatidyltransferase
LSARSGTMNFRQQLVSLPNLVTYVRIMAIPLILVFMRFDTRLNAFIAAMIFAVASASDGLDGYLARRYKLESDLGKFLDPLADKLIVMGTLVMLVHLNRVNVWIAIVLIAREIAVSGLRSVAAAEGLVIAARDLGKKKTAFQMASLWALLIHYTYELDLLAEPFDFNRVGTILLYVALMFSILSAYDYFAGFVRALNTRH